jgi:predicted Zn-ribbon and HTH transcriptional regulator
VEAHGERLVIGPAQCRDCDFAFTARTRTTKPSRCPRCRSEQLMPPVFEIRSGAARGEAHVPQRSLEE